MCRVAHSRWCRSAVRRARSANDTAGPVPATLDLVSERRAAGLPGAVALSGEDLMSELREQRSRDFYRDNPRLGDRRRYKQHYGERQRRRRPERDGGVSA